jgi:DNA-binding XRE family transcriptional regulator
MIYLPVGRIKSENLPSIWQMKHDVEEFDSKQYLIEFGERLAKIRKSKGYSQDRVCNEGGFSRGTLSKIESGSVDPKLTTLARISEIIGVPLKKILDFE